MSKERSVIESKFEKYGVGFVAVLVVAGFSIGLINSTLALA